MLQRRRLPIPLLSDLWGVLAEYLLIGNDMNLKEFKCLCVSNAYFISVARDPAARMAACNPTPEIPVPETLVAQAA